MSDSSFLQVTTRRSDQRYMQNDNMLEGGKKLLLSRFELTESEKAAVRLLESEIRLWNRGRTRRELAKIL
jgi:hypothetical protein